jgi:hypothetical protein
MQYNSGLSDGMAKNEVVGYLFQVGGAIAILFGIYFAFDIAKVFWPIAGGLAGWYVGWFVRKNL